MEQVYGFNDRKEKNKIWGSLREETVNLTSDIKLEKINESGVFESHKVLSSVSFPVKMIKYGAMVHISVEFGVRIYYDGADYPDETRFDVIDGVGMITISEADSYILSSASKTRIVINTLNPNEFIKYGALSSYYNDIQNDSFWFRITSSGFWIRTQRNIEGGSYIIETIYMADNIE